MKTFKEFITEITESTQFTVDSVAKKLRKNPMCSLETTYCMFNSLEIEDGALYGTDEDGEERESDPSDIVRFV